MNPPRSVSPAASRPRPAAAVLVALLALGALVPGCSGCRGDDPDPNPDPPRTGEPLPADPLLVVDGITVTFGDVAGPVAWFDTLDAASSRRGKMNRVVDEFVLPLLLARREFAEQRRELLASAKALRAIAGNVHELEQNAGDLPQHREAVTPRDVEIPIARFLFDPLHVLAVSDPIEVPQGYVLAGSFDLREHQLVLLDRCDALQVGFTTHDAKSWADWLEGQKVRLRGRVTYFHPDYRDAIPVWLDLP